jgi:hypothetical protein
MKAITVTRTVFGPKLQEVRGIWRNLQLIKKNLDEGDNRVTRKVFVPKLQEVRGIWRNLRDESLKIINRTVIPFTIGESKPVICLIVKS